MYLGPLLDGKCLRDFPPRVEFNTEEVLKRFETPLVYRRYHRIGFHFKFTLSWDNSLITNAQWEILRVIANKNTSLTFIPYPDTYINSSFTVRMTSNLNNLTPFKHISTGYKGNITLETVSPVVEIPAWAT